MAPLIEVPVAFTDTYLFVASITVQVYPLATNVVCAWVFKEIREIKNKKNAFNSGKYLIVNDLPPPYRK